MEKYIQEAQYSNGEPYGLIADVNVRCIEMFCDCRYSRQQFKIAHCILYISIRDDEGIMNVHMIDPQNSFVMLLT